MKKKFSRKDVTVLLLILFLALSFRLYKFNTPLADWHSWRQVDTAAVARNFVNDGFDLLHPRFDDLSNAQTGEYNPEGLRFVEFPAYNATFAAMYKVFPVMPLHQYGRLVTILFSLAAIAIVYYLLLMEVSRPAAFFGASVYSFMPFFVYYSRVVLPDPVAVSSVFIAIFFLYQWTRDKKMSWKTVTLYSLSLFFAMLAVLIKPTAGFYYLALAYLFFRKYEFKVFTRPEFYAYFIVALIPFALWRYWISMFPVGGPGFEWLITSVNTFEGQKKIFMRPAYFRWVFYERILLLIMGGWSAGFVFLGAVRKVTRPWLMYSIGASAMLYLLVFQGGNVQHDYYQIIIFPALAMFAGMGVGLLFEIQKKLMPQPFLILGLLAVFGFSAVMSFEQVKGMYGISESLMNTARVIDTVTPKDALVVTDTFGDTTLLYNANRRGMPVIADSLENLKGKGMEYFVTSNESEIQNTYENHPELEVVFENEDVTIFKL